MIEMIDVLRSSRLSDTYMSKFMSPLVQIMAWRLFGTQPFSETKLAYDN